MLLYMVECVNQLYMSLTNVTIYMEERVKQLYISLTNVIVYGGTCKTIVYVINQCYCFWRNVSTNCLCHKPMLVYMEERVNQLYMSFSNVTVYGGTCYTIVYVINQCYCICRNVLNNCICH